MKIFYKILLTAIAAILLLFACKQKQKKETKAPEHPEFLADSVLEIPGMDKMVARKKRPVVTTAPSASPVILLDFDGHTVSNTAWNVNGDIVCAGSGLSPSQRQMVTDTVTSHYSMFNVLVTTDEKKYNKAPLYKRMRVIVTTSYEWYGVAGGVAYLNSFEWGNNTPCFVFSSLHNFVVKNIEDAVSHEAGHTLGLRHQSSYDTTCVKTSEYNWGCCGTAPIMGGSYYQPRPMWWVGPNAISCTTIQNDTLIIKQKLTP